MDPTNFRENQRINFIDKHSIARRGVIQRVKLIDDKRHFITVKSDLGDVEVIQDLKRIVSTQ